MRYLHIKNWAEFQHYKDRNPPWIKLHRALLDDYEFSKLPDATKGQLMMMWVFASQNGGRVPDDPTFLQEKLSLDKQPDLQALVEYGFLVPEHDASNPIAERKQDASGALAFARSREKRREEAEENTRHFGRFWIAYPKRVAKPAALKAWKKLNLNFEQFEALMASLEQVKISEDWRKDGGRYIPHPTTWLNGRRFEDELSLEAAQTIPMTNNLGNCDCGQPATVKVGGKPRCAVHVRGMAAAA